MIYLAGPFFSKEQLEVQKAVEAICESSGHDYYSPRLNITLGPNSTAKEQRAANSDNIAAIRGSSMILARVDDYDPGTVWEAGYSRGASLAKPIVWYSVVKKRRLKCYAQT